MKRFTPARCPVQEKFAATRTELAAALIERDDEIDLLLTALVCQEHALLVGPPGCAKSLLLDALLAWTGGRKFSILLTKFSVPEEVLLENDQADSVEDWSPDGKYLLYSHGTNGMDTQLWAVALEGERKPWMVVAHAAVLYGARLSPDG